MTEEAIIPIITIDGPSASGKGTIAKKLSAILGFHYLDSGAIYRSLAFLLQQNKWTDDETTALKAIDDLKLTFVKQQILLAAKDITSKIRGEEIGILASKISAYPSIRIKLLQLQRDFARTPGLVTDGRDMGSIVFPQAQLKIFLNASIAVRASRRLLQLQNLSSLQNSINYDKIEDILADLNVRDLQDQNRKVSPLIYDKSYKVVDNSTLTIAQTVDIIIKWYRA